MTSPVTGKVICTKTATVTSYQLNGPVDSSVFAFDMPDGTRVVNETGEGPSDYITRAKGGDRVIAPSDIGKTYQEIVSTPGPSLVPGWRRWTGLLLAGFLGLGVLLIAARVLIRRAGRQPLPPCHPEAG
jgi:hypothetical protein